MTEYRTKPLPRETLLAELEHVCSRAAGGAEHLLVSYGWDSALELDEMWQGEPVAAQAVRSHVLEAEVAGTVEVGKADIFVEANGFALKLCHEGDVHISGDSALVAEIEQRWRERGYEPYAVAHET